MKINYKKIGIISGIGVLFILIAIQISAAVAICQLKNHLKKENVSEEAKDCIVTAVKTNLSKWELTKLAWLGADHFEVILKEGMMLQLFKCVFIELSKAMSEESPKWQQELKNYNNEFKKL